MKKLPYLLASIFALGLFSTAQAQSTPNVKPETEYQATPKPDPTDLDSPPPVGLLGNGGEVKLEEASLYPNPGDGLLRVKLGDQNKANSIAVYDIAGRVYLESEIDPLAKNDPQIDLRSLPKGVYVVRVGTKNLKYRKI
ncbi:T9SS type A sorting domain-containing protein [Croceimicrobium sp.]|uniref:T9SS type A sorting domain-containing protein n=1 Tax=Croceimicrobium sp. TaxID=2828340 RepID=UPI003BAB951F